GTVHPLDISGLPPLVLVLLGVLALLGAAVIGFDMWRYTIPPRALIATIGALVYLASPVEVLPEAMLGPLGLLDEAGAVSDAAVNIREKGQRTRVVVRLAPKRIFSSSICPQ